MEGRLRSGGKVACSRMAPLSVDFGIKEFSSPAPGKMEYGRMGHGKMEPGKKDHGMEEPGRVAHG